ncbi:hypothetical protein ABT026_00325 [Streptomyces sp. NPDC002734]|uniref:hypothetical protein n=1 Tax=Streptomyces sp. NPDC002734 TaxID=3154426 RepID=UPI003319038B
MYSLFDDPGLVHLMRQVAVGAAGVEIPRPVAHPAPLASLVHVAECYGFRYSHVRVGNGIMNWPVVVVLHRDDSPGGRRRAAATVATLPPATGGMLPGLRPGRLPRRPDPEAQLDLIRAHVTFDVLTRLPLRRGQALVWAMTAPILLLMVATGEYAVMGSAALLMLLMPYGGIAGNRLRRRRLARRLRAAGCVPILAEDGRPGFSRSVPSDFGGEAD